MRPFRVAYISLLPALSSGMISLPPLPKKGSKLYNSRDAPGVDAVHSRRSYHHRMPRPFLEDTVSPEDYEASFYVVCAAVFYSFVFKITLGLLFKDII